MRIAPYHRFNRHPLRLMFSADFSEFASTRFLSAGYRIVIAIVALAVGFWCWVGLSLAEWAGWGIAGLICIAAIIGGMATLTAIRTLTEALIVGFDIAETLHKIDKSSQYIAYAIHESHESKGRHAEDAEIAHAHIPTE